MKFNLLLAVLGCFISRIHSFESNIGGNDKNCHGSTLPLRFADSSRKPNIILILTDDQDAELGSMNFMPRTKQYLRKQGAEFRHAYATTPMCCPSRSSILTGQYVHNHHVYSNNENCSSPNWRKHFEDKSFATYVQKQGYKTAYFGKYLNQYDGTYIPNGWDYWNTLIRNSKYYNYTVNVNGKKIKHGFDYSKDYYPDLIRNESIQFLQNHFTNSSANSKQPLMMVLSFPSPHGPEDSAPQYSHMFPNVTTHHTPSYDYAPNFDKQWILKNTGKMTNLEKRFTDILMTKRLQTLQSVDVSVETIYRTLQSLKELENTFLFYMSDHGYHLGQFGLVKGKSFPFEVDVKVPFMVRGPGIDAGSIINDVVLNIDIAPTFLSIAGVRPPEHMDGKSILNFQKNCFSDKNKNSWRKTFLIESPGKRNYELLENSKSKINRTLRPYTKQKRLAFECQNSDELQLPCKPSQKWYCVQDESGDWRKHKCKMIDQSQTNKCRCVRSVDDLRIKNATEIMIKNQSDKTKINENGLLFLKSKLSFFEKHKLNNESCKNQMNCMIKKSMNNESALKESQNRVDFIINQLKRKLSNWRKVSRILSRLDNERTFVDSSFNMINKNSNCDCGQSASAIAVVKKKHRKMRRKLKSENCSEPGMFCFRQDRNHWRTEPMWQFDSFCSCNNAANNSYSCLRTIDDTHNFLYCEFVTNFVTFYDLNQDKYQRENRINLLSYSDRTELHNELAALKSCKGNLCSNYEHTFAVSS